MANVIYPAAKAGMMQGSVDLINNGLNIALVSTSYTYGSGHSNYTSDGVSAATVGTPQTLGSKTVSTSGVFDAADVTFPTVAAGSTVKALVIYRSSDGLLIAYIDTGTGFPPGGFSTNGGNITVTFNNGSTKIFQL